MTLAEETFQKILKINSSYENAIYNLAAIYINQGKYYDALEKIYLLKNKDGAALLSVVYPLIEEKGLSYKKGAELINKDDIKPVFPSTYPLGWLDYPVIRAEIKFVVDENGKPGKRMMTLHNTEDYDSNIFNQQLEKISEEAKFEPAITESGKKAESLISLKITFSPDESFLYTENEGLYEKSVKFIVQSGKKDYFSCFKPLLAKDDKLRGSVDFNFTIKEDGTIDKITKEDSFFDDEKFEACVIAKISAMKFPVSKYEKYPYQFKETLKFQKNSHNILDYIF